MKFIKKNLLTLMIALCMSGPLIPLAARNTISIDQETTSEEVETGIEESEETRDTILVICLIGTALSVLSVYRKDSI